MKPASRLLLALTLAGGALSAAEPPPPAPATPPTSPLWKTAVPMLTKPSEPRVLGLPITDANLISYRVCAGYGPGGHDLLCWVTTAESGAHFCALDLTTQQLDIKPLHHREGYPITPAADGAIYVGSTSGEIWCYRATGSSWKVLAQPWSTSATLDAHHIRVLAAGRDGWLYAGSCFGERARVNERTGEVQPLPALAEKGNWYVSAAVPLPDGRIGLVYVDRTGTPAIKLRASADGGRTWPERGELVLSAARLAPQTWRKQSMQDAWAEMSRFSLGLPATARLPGGDLLVVYYSGPHTDQTGIEWVRVGL